MLSWILLIFAIAIAIVVWIKLKEFGHKSKFTALIIVLIIFLGLIIIYLKAVEEKRLLKDFADEYKRYKKKVSMIIPWLPKN